MALKVHTVKRKVLAGEEAGQEKYFGQVRLKEVIPLAKISKGISQDTSLTPSDVEMVINALTIVLADNLDNGNSVDLGEFGSMRLTAGSSGAETKEKFHCRMMRKPRVVFTPGKMFKNAMEDVRYEWLAVRVTEVPEECDEPHAI